jgi:hypothetical protein
VTFPGLPQNVAYDAGILRNIKPQKGLRNHASPEAHMAKKHIAPEYRHYIIDLVAIWGGATQ